MERNYARYTKQHAIIKARPENRAKDRERYRRKQQERAERTGVPTRPVGRPRLYTTSAAIETTRLRTNANHKAWRMKRKLLAEILDTTAGGCTWPGAGSETDLSLPL